MRMFPLAPPPAARVLLVGGHDSDWITANKRLQSRGIEVAWHWPNRSSGHRDFPQCNAVILFTRALAHSLSADVITRAKNADIPVVHHDSWPRTETALDTLQIGIPKAPLTAEPPMTPPKKTEDIDLACIVDAQKKWNDLDETVQVLVRAFAKQADASTGKITLNAPSVRSFLLPMVGNPRLFTAIILLATSGPTNHLTVTGISRLYREVSGRKAEYNTIQGMAIRTRTLLGEEYGIRLGEISPALQSRNEARSAKATTPATTPATTQNPPSPTKAPNPSHPPLSWKNLVTPPPTAVTPPRAPQVRARFETLLYEALHRGETVTAKLLEGDTYALTFEDGTLVTIRNQ